MYIYKHKKWPEFEWDNDRIISLLLLVRNLQGRIVGKMGTLGFDLRNEASLEILTLDVLKSTEIEGELLNPGQVRSSLARRLGLEISGLVRSDRNVDGVVEMTLDATRNFEKKLDKERLLGWQSALFPSGRNGMQKIITGNWRDDSTGPMQVVSGPMGKETVHFQAPEAKKLDKEMGRFFGWFNRKPDVDLVLKAGIAHLWFVTLHPFEDGNGRIARAITDMVLSRSDGQPFRFYSMSTQIRKERKEYYEILEKTQKGDLEITDWLVWFLTCLQHALEASDSLLSKVISKHKFWLRYALRVENERQKKILNMLLDGFDGKLNTSKWARICKCSQDTALRDIQDLMDKGILIKMPGGGRNTGYDLGKT